MFLFKTTRGGEHFLETFLSEKFPRAQCLTLETNRQITCTPEAHSEVELTLVAFLTWDNACHTVLINLIFLVNWVTMEKT